MMKSKVLAVAAVLLGLTLGACGSTQAGKSTGRLQTTVRINGLAGAVAQVKVSITCSDPAASAIAPLVLTAGLAQTYTGTFSQLRVSSNGGPTYDLTAEATDAGNVVLYRGSASGVVVTEQVMATVVIVADSTAPVANDSPVISAMALSAAKIAPGTSVDLTVTAADPDGDALTYTFSRGTCDGSLAGGVEGTPQGANFVTFNAGSTVGACQLEVTVTDSRGLTAEGRVTLNVDSTVVFIVTPTAPAPLPFVAGVDGDGAPGFEGGSIKATGTPKAELYFTPAHLFGHAVTLGDVARMSYWTKKGTTHVDDVQDWFLAIYTTPYAGQASGWYGARIGAEPYLAANLGDAANAWNLWSTDGQTNQLRFFESTNGYFGSYADPSWSDFVNGSSLTGSHTSTPVPYATQELLYFSVQTASIAFGFEGQLDGVRIELKDGSAVEIDMQPSPLIVPVFNALPAVLPPNLPSEAFQATQTAEFGDYITLAGTGRHAVRATVAMSNWGAHSDRPTFGNAAGFDVPITLNIYQADLTATPKAGALIGSVTQRVFIPWRPEHVAGTCIDSRTTVEDTSRWMAPDGKCYGGSLSTITLDLSGITLPDSFVYGITLDTETWGAHPTGVDGPYDSLNVALAPALPSIGSEVTPGTVFENTKYAPYYADGGAAGVGIFRQDTGWAGYVPAVEFFAY